MYLPLFVWSISSSLWNDVQWIVLSPYISRHFFPVVEHGYWLSSCSLERADWCPPARWLPLICTHRFEVTSRPLPIVMMLIGCLSSGFINTVGATTRHSYEQGRSLFHISYIWSWYCSVYNNYYGIRLIFILVFILCQSVYAVLAIWVEIVTHNMSNKCVICMWLTSQKTKVTSNGLACLDVSSVNVHTCKWGWRHTSQVAVIWLLHFIMARATLQPTVLVFAYRLKIN